MRVQGVPCVGAAPRREPLRGVGSAAAPTRCDGARSARNVVPPSVPLQRPYGNREGRLEGHCAHDVEREPLRQDGLHATQLPMTTFRRGFIVQQNACAPAPRELVYTKLTEELPHALLPRPPLQ